MELNSTRTKFPKIIVRNPSVEVVDLSDAALTDAMPTIRKAEKDIKRLNRKIKDMVHSTEDYYERALQQ